MSLIPSPTNGTIDIIGVIHTPLFNGDLTGVVLTEVDNLECFLIAVSCTSAATIIATENNPLCGCTTHAHTHHPTPPKNDRIDIDTTAAAQR